MFKQLSTTLPKNNKKRIIIAYEPVWAIGSGRTPKLDEVVEINLFIKQAIKKINSSYNKTEILYGGSTNENNASYFLKNENIDGLLVGGTSLNFKKFSLILNHKYV